MKHEDERIFPIRGQKTKDIQIESGDERIETILDAIRELKKYVYSNPEASRWASDITKTLEELRSKYKRTKAVSELEATLDLLELAFISFGKILSSYCPKVVAESNDLCQECGKTVTPNSVSILCRDCYNRIRARRPWKQVTKLEKLSESKQPERELVQGWQEENRSLSQQLGNLRQGRMKKHESVQEDKKRGNVYRGMNEFFPIRRPKKNRDIQIVSGGVETELQKRKLTREQQINQLNMEESELWNTKVMNALQMKQLEIEQQIQAWVDYAKRHPEYQAWVNSHIKLLERAKKRLS